MEEATLHTSGTVSTGHGSVFAPLTVPPLPPRPSPIITAVYWLKCLPTYMHLSFQTGEAIGIPIDHLIHSLIEIISLCLLAIIYDLLSNAYK